MSGDPNFETALQRALGELREALLLDVDAAVARRQGLGGIRRRWRGNVLRLASIRARELRRSTPTS